MKKEGHSIGHHGMNHAILDSNKLSTKDIINEIYIPKMLIEKITGETVRFFRSPYGRRNQRVLNILDIYNQTHILWNIDSMDWRKEMTPKTIVDHVTRLAHLYEGGIVLFHDFTGKIPSFLPQLLETLIDKGFNFNSFHDKF